MKQKTRNKLIFKKLKVRLFEIKLKQKVMQDPETIDNLSKKKKKNLLLIGCQTHSKTKLLSCSRSGNSCLHIES